VGGLNETPLVAHIVFHFRLINLLRDGKDAEIECMLQESSYELKRKKDTNGWSLLHHAAKQGRAEAAELLLEEGAYVNARDRDDNTPLHIACLSVAAAVAHRLVLYGADVEVRNKEVRQAIWCLTEPVAGVADCGFCRRERVHYSFQKNLKLLLQSF
jgi:hypothetical protein